MALATDRRVARTHRLLSEALIELILQRGYDRITVQDILDRADVGRSTFYTHFQDKQALLLSCFDGLRDELHRDLDPDGTGGDAGRAADAIFALAYEHRRVFRAMCGRRGGTIVHGHLHTMIRTAFAAHLPPHPAAAGSPVPAEAVAEFYTAALLGLLVWWVGRDFPEPPAELAALYRQLVTTGWSMSPERVHSAM
jgi:AcrR family transcriptional regulator